LRTMWKNRGLMSKYIHVILLSPHTSIQVKKSKAYFLTYPRIKNVYVRCVNVNKQVTTLLISKLILPKDSRNRNGLQVFPFLSLDTDLCCFPLWQIIRTRRWRDTA
jgi:hypothetical protein